MAKPKMKLEDIADPKVRKIVREKLGLPATTRKTTFTKDHVRGHAIRVLAAIAGLSQAQRRRVLTHARRLNEV